MCHSPVSGAGQGSEQKPAHNVFFVPSEFKNQNSIPPPLLLVKRIAGVTKVKSSDGKMFGFSDVPSVLLPIRIPRVTVANKPSLGCGHIYISKTGKSKVSPHKYYVGRIDLAACASTCTRTFSGSWRCSWPVVCSLP